MHGCQCEVGHMYTGMQYVVQCNYCHCKSATCSVNRIANCVFMCIDVHVGYNNIW